MSISKYPSNILVEMVKSCFAILVCFLTGFKEENIGSRSTGEEGEWVRHVIGKSCSGKPEIIHKMFGLL